ncbi:MAG: HEAT repeat domain-containing protein [Chloroflexi bacterium]|nr:HEAT repeat domain-containing protein [Chloroflexota bacterium]
MDAVRLTDDQMRTFIRDGYITVRPNLPREYHDEMFAKVDEVFQTEGNPGNNILPRIPELQLLYDDPVTRGALAGIMGDDYYLEPHRFVHFNQPHSKGQTLHKDSFTRRRHHTRWLVTFYYPQDTPLEMGPTGVVPGTQYTNVIPEDSYDREIGAAGDAGRIVIANYDIVHRGMPNHTDRKRYMVKFLFNRMGEPTAPSWDNKDAEWGDEGGEYSGLLSHAWDWFRADTNGGHSANGASVEDLITALSGDSEHAAFDATYTLSDIGEPAVGPLIDAMRSGSADNWYNDKDRLRRIPGQMEQAANASYALAAMGGHAVPALVDSMTTSEEWDKALAAETLGDIGLEGRDAVQPLTEASRDIHPAVRGQAVEALGQVAQGTSDAVPALIDALSDEDETVRRNSALAIAKLGPTAVEAVESLSALLNDPNRYVLGNAAEALKRIGTPESTEILIDHLMTARWCPVTRQGSLY